MTIGDREREALQCHVSPGGGDLSSHLLLFVSFWSSPRLNKIKIAILAYWGQGLANRGAGLVYCRVTVAMRVSDNRRRYSGLSKPISSPKREDRRMTRGCSLKLDRDQLTLSPGILWVPPAFLFVFWGRPGRPQDTSPYRGGLPRRIESRP